MKKKILSISALLAFSSLLHADATAPTSLAEVPFYAGIGMGVIQANNDFTSEKIDTTTIALHAGIKVNQYLALEGRYAFGVSTDYESGSTNGVYNGNLSSWGVYAKPMYPISNFDIYALLGFGGVTMSDVAGGNEYQGSFQWGLGGSYSITKEIAVSLDYLSLYNGTGFGNRAQNHTIKVDSIALALSYKF